MKIIILALTIILASCAAPQRVTQDPTNVTPSYYYDPTFFSGYESAPAPQRQVPKAAPVYGTRCSTLYGSTSCTTTEQAPQEGWGSAFQRGYHERGNR